LFFGGFRIFEFGANLIIIMGSCGEMWIWVQKSWIWVESRVSELKVVGMSRKSWICVEKSWIRIEKSWIRFQKSWIWVENSWTLPCGRAEQMLSNDTLNESSWPPAARYWAIFVVDIPPPPHPQPHWTTHSQPPWSKHSQPPWSKHSQPPLGFYAPATRSTPPPGLALQGGGGECLVKRQCRGWSKALALGHPH